MSDLNSVKREIEAEARRLFPGAVRRVEWLRYGDAPVIEPGEILPQFVLAEPAGLHGTNVKRMLRSFQEAHTPALKRFRLELAGRWPQIRHLGVTFEDDRGRRSGGMIQALDDEHGPQGHDRGIPVTVRLDAAELEIADRLITTRARYATARASPPSTALSRSRQCPLAAAASSRKATVPA